MKKVEYFQKKLIFLIIILNFSNHCNANQLVMNVSSGYERITSPLVRIDVDSPLMLVEGRYNLAGRYCQFSVSGGKDWDFANDNTFELNGNASVKKAPEAEGLNFSLISIDAIWRKKIGDIYVGIGPSVQRIWVANEMFRDSVSLQSDFTNTQTNGSYTNLYLATARNYFVNEYQFFNSNSYTASLSKHIKDVGLGFSALDLEFSASRNKNVMDSDDLSNYSYYGRASIDRQMIGLTWSVGAAIIQSYFDEPIFDGFAKRHDKYVSYEFGVEREFNNHLTMSLDITKARNSSNLSLFESDYKAASLSLKYNF